MKKSEIFDRTLFLSRLTSTMIESASANLFSSADKSLGMKKLSKRERIRSYHMLIMNRPQVRLEPIKENISKAVKNISMRFQKQPLQYMSPYKISKLNRKVF